MQAGEMDHRDMLVSSGGVYADAERQDGAERQRGTEAERQDGAERQRSEEADGAERQRGREADGAERQASSGPAWSRASGALSRVFLAAAADIVIIPATKPPPTPPANAAVRAAASRAMAFEERSEPRLGSLKKVLTPPARGGEGQRAA